MLIGQLPHALAFDEPADRLQNQVGLGLGHHEVPFGRNQLSSYIVPSDAGRSRLFFKVTRHSACMKATRPVFPCLLALQAASSMAMAAGRPANQRLPPRQLSLSVTD